jgi:hypothetical protein
MSQDHDDRLDGLVRAALATRDPGRAPESLRNRIAAVAEPSASPGRRRLSPDRARGLAGLAAAATIVVAMGAWLAGRSVAPSTVGGSPASLPTALPSGMQPVWPPLVPGFPTGPDLRLAGLGAAILIVAGTVALIRGHRSHVRIRQIAVGVSIFVLVGLAAVEMQYAPLAAGGMSGPVLPQDRRVDPDSASGGHSVVYVFYRSGGAFQIGFSVRNDGPLATTFDGLSNALALNELRFFRFVDLRLPRDPTVDMGSTDETTQPFRSIDLAPGADVYVIARFQFATCEQADLPVVPGLDAPETDPSQGYMSIDTMSVRSHVFLLERTTDIPIGMSAAFPQPSRCAH